MSYVIRELRILKELLPKVITESLITLSRLCNECLQEKDLLEVEEFSDAEVDGWEGIVIKFRTKGDYEELLKIWDGLSITTSKVLGRYSKYVYVAVEPKN